MRIDGAAIDVFGLWWMWLVSVWLAEAAGRPARRYLWRLMAVYVGVAAMVAMVSAAGASIRIQPAQLGTCGPQPFRPCRP